MNESKTMKTIIIMLFISSFSILLAFAGDYGGKVIYIICAYATGILFWTMLILAYCLFVVLNFKRKKQLKVKSSAIKQMGFFRLFSNSYARIFDILLFVFLLLTILFFIVPVFNQALSVIFLSCFLFSLHMHGILNGVNYKYIFEEGGSNNEQK